MVPARDLFHRPVRTGVEARGRVSRRERLNMRTRGPVSIWNFVTEIPQRRVAEESFNAEAQRKKRIHFRKALAKSIR